MVLCGRYEGIDERVREALATDEISIGDYVLTGGELPALVMLDAVARLVPGVVGDARSVGEDSFARGAAGSSALHAAGGVRGTAGAGRAALGAPRARSSGGGRETALRRTLERRPDLLESLASREAGADAERTLSEIRRRAVRARGPSGRKGEQES